MWFYPVLTLLTIAAMIAVLVSMGVRGDTRSQLFLSLLALAVVLAAYPLSRRFTGPSVLRPASGAVPAPAAGVRSGPLTASRVLVVANETVGADELLGELRQLQNEASAEYFVCVPAHPLHTGQGAAWSPDASVIAAQHRLDQVLSILKDEGLRASGELGDYRPLHALDDAVKKFRPDLIVISTHPEERSAWLRQDIVERAKNKYNIIVRHIVSHVPVDIYGT
jgi:GABA permease